MTAEQIQDMMDENKEEFAAMGKAELAAALADMGAMVNLTKKRIIVHVDGTDYVPAWFDSYCDRVVLVEL